MMTRNAIYKVKDDRKGERWVNSKRRWRGKVFVIGQVFRLKVADVLYQGCNCGTVLRWE